MRSGKLDRRIRIERPIADESLDGAGSGDWQFVAEVAANVQDMLPSRGERIAEGINVAARPARVRIRYRADVASNMRILVGRNRKDGSGEMGWQTDRVAQIVTVPAEIGRREALEFVIEDYTSAGNPA
jgi:head-tail adaptor